MYSAAPLRSALYPSPVFELPAGGEERAGKCMRAPAFSPSLSPSLSLHVYKTLISPRAICRFPSQGNGRRRERRQGRSQLLGCRCQRKMSVHRIETLSLSPSLHFLLLFLFYLPRDFIFFLLTSFTLANFTPPDFPYSFSTRIESGTESQNYHSQLI